MRNQAVFRAFLCCMLARECYPEASTMSSSANLVLTSAVMVDNLAEKVKECAKSGSLSIDWDQESCPLYRVPGCLLFRGCLSIEVNGRQSGLSELSILSWVSAIEGCPLNRGFHCTEYCNTGNCRMTNLSWMFSILIV